ncbi:c-type cytochrome [Arenimonas composti]|uniref:Cytochrome c domain-containing protein n=1 Tax=Arenimonas composti TR7-09 = DSM 18010 TaxID=1121013 RepID=A0A091B0Q8_9GAMM|nr:cytochrome c [Arenimonas composti]KFN45291.1 hypothetical protein P873_02390 [Arenimonas composti TR7-09 = DSM 18010]
MLRTAALLSVLLLALPAHAAAPVGDPAAGAQTAKTCASCHGATGNESLDGTYPLLAGQHADYLAKALRDYRSGARSNAVMAGFAQALSDEDIDNVAAYFASQPGALHDLSRIDQR